MLEPDLAVTTGPATEEASLWERCSGYRGRRTGFRLAVGHATVGGQLWSQDQESVTLSGQWKGGVRFREPTRGIEDFLEWESNIRDGSSGDDREPLLKV